MISSIVNFVKNTFSSAVPLIENTIDTQQNQIDTNKFFIPDNTKEPRWQTWFPFTFFYGGGKLQPIYCFTFLFAILSASMFTIKIAVAYRAFIQGTYTTDMISSTDLATVLAFVSSLILLYNGNKKNQSTFNPTIVSSTTQVTTDIDNKSQEGDGQP